MSCPSSCAPRRVAVSVGGREAPDRGAQGPCDQGEETVAEPAVDLERWCSVVGARRGGRREWPRVARRELEAHREREAQPIPRDREDRLFQALGRLSRTIGSIWPPTLPMSVARDGAGHQGRVLKGNSKPFVAARAAGGRDQPLRSGLAGDAHTGHSAPSGLQRADRGQRPADHPRGRDHYRRRRTSGIWSRCSTPPSRARAARRERAARGGAR